MEKTFLAPQKVDQDIEFSMLRRGTNLENLPVTIFCTGKLCEMQHLTLCFFVSRFGGGPMSLKACLIGPSI